MMDDAPQVTLLDGFAIRTAAGDPQASGAELPHVVQRLVAHLCLSGRPPRSALAGQLWPEASEAHAHGSLRSALWRVHKALPGLVQASGDHLSLVDGVRVDVHELGDWAQRVRDPRSPLEDVEIPASGLRGELLPGWYDDWVLLERERLRQVRLHALERVATRLAAAGRYGDALEAAYAAVRAEPLRESAHRTVVCVHLAEGNVAEALRAYDQFCVLLSDELGVAPSDHMRRLVPQLARVPEMRQRLLVG
ncbi:BTAD domain-containing putative transcriptional regulator [Blastococcus sp. URHD0036]|uniref:AfsR/SARP family transcriptional regulator n=1 Tax=Blastococcus sp. URHD0036 TaxID=1380356 RepID=UPI001E56B584|nr:BTAD domain-containing putative transcriptional regulator [Blastococcus sp. URHD0036]